MRVYEIVNTKTGKISAFKNGDVSGKFKNGNTALRTYGCNVPVGGKSTYKTKGGRPLKARLVKG